ncbi:MAG TPA: hypothetical protein CFH81_02225 [Sulfurovum sp. UBA12169]|nr:MAG TPA: hypothetical protein CFH81_02225 [Sulfurovum sp. UBA12169]
MELMTASQCLKCLNDDGIVDWSEGYFSQRVKAGIFTIHHKPGSPKKFFKYEEVKQAVLDNIDPRREAQREANTLKRKPDNGLIDMIESAPPLTPEQEEAERKRLKEIFDKNKEQEEIAGLLDIDELTGDEKKKTEDMTIKDLNMAIMRQDLRIKRATADEKESNSILKDKVYQSHFRAFRVVRDRIMVITNRVMPYYGSLPEHDFRNLLNEEITMALNESAEAVREL